MFKNTIKLLTLFIILFLLFPQEYMKYIGSKINHHQVSKIAINLQELYFSKGILYSCDRLYIYGFKGHMNYIVPIKKDDILLNIYKNIAPEKVINFYHSDIYTKNNFIFQEYISEYNKLIIQRCGINSFSR